MENLSFESFESEDYRPDAVDENAFQPVSLAAEINVLGSLLIDAEKYYDVNRWISIILVELVGELNAALGVELDNTALFDNPTIAQLARAVAQTAPSEPTAPPSPPSASSALTPPATEMDELALLEALAAGTCSVEDVELMMEDYR